MKQIAWLIVPVFIGLASLTSNAQAQQFGVTGGVNISRFNGVGSVSTREGMTIGGFVEYGFIGGVTLQPELLFSMKGASGTYGTQVSLKPSPVAPGERYDWTLNYIELPILLKFNVLSVPIVPVDVDIYAGPDFAFNVASTNKTTLADLTTTTNETGNTQPFDFNIVVGGGPNFNLGSMTLGVEARYTFGTGSIFKNGSPEAPATDARNGMWSIMASLGF